MKFESTPRFDRRLRKRISKNPKLTKSIRKQLQLLQQNPRHPSLKLHKLEGKRIHEYTVWIESDLRITFQIIGNIILLSDIITHDEYWGCLCLSHTTVREGAFYE